MKMWLRMQQTNTFVRPQNINVKAWKQETYNNILSEVSEIALKFTKLKICNILLLLNALFKILPKIDIQFCSTV
jgi:hypothetical protein